MRRGEKESAISANVAQFWKVGNWFRKNNLEQRMIKKGEQNEGLRGSKTGETAISILGGGGDVEMPHGRKMQDSTVNKLPRTRNSEKEVEVPQSLAIWGYLVLGNARYRILENGDILSLREQDASKLENGNKRIFSGVWGKCAKIGKRRENPRYGGI